MIITRTPFRITLGGGGTDLPSYYNKYGGFLISAAINKYMYITVNKRFEDSIRVSYSKTEIISKVDEIEHPIVRETLKLLGIKSGLEITSIADLPARSGVGSSGSFTVGLLNALHTYKREYLSPKELAEEATRAFADGKTRALLMQNHGLLTVGKGLNEAVHIAEEVEEAARIFVLTRGKPKLIPSADLKKIRALP